MCSQRFKGSFPHKSGCPLSYQKDLVLCRGHSYEKEQITSSNFTKVSREEMVKGSANIFT